MYPEATYSLSMYHMTAILSLVLFIAVITDIKSRRIPNVLTFPSAFLAMVMHGLHGGFHGFLFGLYGMVAGTLLLIVPYMMGGMGAGDAKLMGMVGAFLGVKAVLVVFVLTALCGGMYAVGLVLVKRTAFKGFFREQAGTVKSIILTGSFNADIPSGKGRPRLCYGIAIALGTYIYMGLDFSGLSF